MVGRRQAPIPEPPAHLSGRAKGLWSELVGTRVRSPGRVALFQAALEALDRADEARATVTTEGMVSITKTSGVVHMHPLLRVEREARGQFAKIWSDLRLTWDHSIDG